METIEKNILLDPMVIQKILNQKDSLDLAQELQNVIKVSELFRENNLETSSLCCELLFDLQCHIFLALGNRIVAEIQNR